ncbi:sugar transporter [Nitrincola iocasae]|uniref:Sugar transporter n=1 Tax=Nitrincola iocasae TaxID=2614693 RepID=A0A5J6LF04_9GAMM|nr:sugar transporter [Nitrincola iocasae]QEW07115.1 sugar transporter [Nitrincola iocasae]
MPTEQPSAQQAWLAVISLAFSAFVFNTSEFAPIGLLSGIADSFDMHIAETGLMMTYYAWVVALASLPAIILLSDVERRRLLIAVFSLFIISHLLSAVAWSFTVLMISRIGIALAHAVFWAITAAIAMRIAPEGRKTQAVSLLITGATLASILGLPVGRLVSEWFNWRVTFLLIGGCAALVLLVILRVMPNLPSRNAGSISSLPLLLRRPALIGLYVLVLLIVTAHFTVYSYIEPLVQQVLGFSGSLTTMVLLVYGLAGFLAALMFSRLYRHLKAGVLVFAVSLIVLSMLALVPLTTTSTHLMLIAACWGMGITLITLAAQVLVLELAADATDVATAIFSGIYNVGIGGGALVGSQIILSRGLDQTGYAGGLIGLVALAWLVFFCFVHLSKSNSAA